MRTLHVWPQAQLDITDAAGWHEERRAGLGIRFLEDVDHLLNRIRRQPLQFPMVDPEVRRGLLTRFPYSVYFTLSEACIEVIAVLHQHRHPDTWRGRTPHATL